MLPATPFSLSCLSSSFGHGGAIIGFILFRPLTCPNSNFSSMVLATSKEPYLSSFSDLMELGLASSALCHGHSIDFDPNSSYS